MIFELLRKYKSVISYLVFGMLTTVVNIAVYYILFNISGMANVPATIVAWIAAVIFAFITNKLWVFDSKSFEIKVLLHEIFSFFTCRILTGILDIAIMWFTVDKMQWNSLIWKIISNILVIVLNFVASKFLIFVKRKNENEKFV